MPHMVTYTVSDMNDPSLYREVEDFFRRHPHRSFHSNNMLFQARIAGRLIGLVRLCLEENQSILRSMEVKKELQRQRIGTELLKQLVVFADAKGTSPIFCLPYAHLVPFYSQAGFELIDGTELPKFLHLRLEAYRRKRPESKFCAMIRLSRDH